MLIGFLFSVIAGAAMSVQGVMNTRLQEHVGLWEANAYVQGTAFALSLVVMWLFGTGNLGALASAPRGYLLGGALGLVITVTVMLAIKGLNVTVAVSVILIAQLLVAAVIDALRLDGTGKGAHGTLAVRRAGADAGRCGAVQVSLTSASSPSSRTVVMSLSWLIASLSEVRVSLTC